MTGEEKLARLQRALDYGGGTHRVADVVQLVREGKAQFWPPGGEGDGCIVTEIHEFPLFKAIHYWLIWGELRACLSLEHEINPWAVEQGCTIATATGRRGWGRVAAPTGWRPAHPNFFKPLIGGGSYGRRQ
jgi:hypothetical protein